MEQVAQVEEVDPYSRQDFASTETSPPSGVDLASSCKVHISQKVSECSTMSKKICSCGYKGNKIQSYTQMLSPMYYTTKCEIIG
jgi:hypothetical protein